MRAVDAAEMEFRQAYIDHDSAAVEGWAESHYPGTFAGYYVDHHNGGIAHIGFTQEQTQRVSDIKQQLSLMAPHSRVAPYPTTPTTSRVSVTASSETISEALESNPTLRALVSEIDLDEEDSVVRVGASNVGQVEGLLDQIVGAQAPVSVHYQPKGLVRMAGRYRSSGRILAGDHLWTEPEPSKAGECTAGFGAWEDRTKKSTGDPVRARFLLTAGHCGYLGSPTARSATTALKDLAEVGPVNRNAWSSGAWRTDSLAIRVAGGLSPQEIYRKGLAPLPVGSPTRAKRTNVLCFSGYKTDRKECGEVIGRPEIVEPGFREFIYYVRMRADHGDSGAPVWNPNTGAAVGLLIGEPPGRPDITAVAPLLPMLNKSVSRVPGALKAMSLSNSPDLNLILGH